MKGSLSLIFIVKRYNQLSKDHKVLQTKYEESRLELQEERVKNQSSLEKIRFLEIDVKSLESELQHSAHHSALKCRYPPS